MRSQKIRLKLTKEQEEKAWRYAYVSRHFWNLLVEMDRKNNLGEYDDLLLKKGNTTYYSKHFSRNIYRLNPSDYLYLAKLAVESYSKSDSNQKEWEWYFKDNQSFIYNSTAKKLAEIKRRNKGKLRFKAAGKTTPSFQVRCDSLYASCKSGNGNNNIKRASRIYLKEEGRLQIPTIGSVEINRTREGFELDCKKQTATISFDGKYWYLAYTENADIEPVISRESIKKAFGIGIDLGINNLAALSDGSIIPNIKSLRRFKVLSKRLKTLQKKVSRKYYINKCNKYNKTKNIKKLEKKIRLIHRSIKNLRLQNIREFIARLIKKSPGYVAIEDLNVKGMMKNRHLAREIANASFYKIREHLTRKAKENGIVVRVVKRFYPSSKLCSHCNAVKKGLKLSDRIFECPKCKTIIDRDLNAALNLANATEFELA